MRTTLLKLNELPPARDALKSDQLFRFQDVLDDPGTRHAINVFLTVLDRGDVLVGTIFGSALDIPGIVPACLALAGDASFIKAAKGNSRLRKLLGMLLRIRLADLGLRPRGRKGMVSRWTNAFQM